MTESLGDIIKNKRFQEPDEVLIIKTFVKDNYKVTPEVTIYNSQIVIGVNSAALAGTLRMRLHELKELCQTKKRLVLRII